MHNNNTTAYSCIHIYHIIRVLQTNLVIIHDLIRIVEASGVDCPLDTLLKTASDETDFCLRILDKEGVHA